MPPGELDYPGYDPSWPMEPGGNAALCNDAIIAALITVLVVVAVAVAGSWLYSMWVRLLSLLG